MCGVTVNTYTGTVGGAALLIRSHLYKLHDFSMHHWHNLGFEVNLDHFKSLVSIPFIQIVVVKIHDLGTIENTEKRKKSYLFLENLLWPDRNCAVAHSDEVDDNSRISPTTSSLFFCIASNPHSSCSVYHTHSLTPSFIAFFTVSDV